jgi:Flp pilus assembly protein TadG
MNARASLLFWRANKGGSAVEFALVVTPLLMLAMGVFEFGRYYWTTEALQESAVAGARCIGISQSSCASAGVYNSGNTASYVQGVAAGWGVTVPTSDIVTTNSTTCGTLTGFAQVKITYLFKTVIPNIIPIGAGGQSITVQSCYPNNPSS